MFLPILFLASFFILNTTAETDCAGYSIDKCALPDDSIIETLKDVGEDDCQFYCNVIYSPDCTFYIYDKQQVLCQLLNSPMNGYVSSCSKYAGPPTPSVAKCLSSTDACKYYVDGFCRYLGDLEEHLENIPSVGTCQQACQHYTGCKYWVYDEDQKDCELLNSNERICDVSRGPPNPTYAECFPGINELNDL